MRAFYAAYEKIIRLAMSLGWTQNVAILERCSRNEERVWYIRAVLFGWKKVKLLEAIESQAWTYSSLDEQTVSCYPNVSNRFITGLAPQTCSLDVELDRFTREQFGQHYVSEEFYTGISDLSYTSLFQQRRNFHRAVQVHAILWHAVRYLYFGYRSNFHAVHQRRPMG